jgi:hypothetical protein
MEREEEGQQCDGERSPLLELVAVGKQSKDDGPSEWGEGDDRQNVVVYVHLLPAMFIDSLVQKKQIPTG